MKSATFKIDGMRCEACARTIQAVITTEHGVQTAAVSFPDRQARVLYDPKATSEDTLAASVERAGFKVAARSP